MQHVLAAACRKKPPVRAAQLLAIALVAAVAAFEAETRSDLRPWGVLGLWLCSVAAFLGGAALLHPPDRQARAHLSRIDLAALAALTLGALLARTVALGTIPWNMDGDAGELGVFSRVVLDGQWNDPFTVGEASHPSLWFFLQALSLRIFGDDIVGLRMLVALMGTATVPALYLFARPWYGRRVALMASALLLTYHFHIHFSRTGVNQATDALFAVVAFGLFLAGWRARSPLLFAAAGVSVGFAQNLYYGTRLEPVVLVVVLVHQLIFSRAEVAAVARYLPLTALGFVIGWGPGVRVPLYRWNDYKARDAVVGVFESGWFRGRQELGETPIQILWHQVLNAGGAITSVADRGPHYVSGMPLLDPVSSALFLVGLAVVLYEWRRIESALLLAWLLIALVFGGVLLVNPPEVQRFVTLAPLLCLLIALGIDRGARFLTNAIPQVRRFVPALAALCVAGLGAWSLHFYFAVYTPRNDLGFRTTESATAIGRYLAARPGRYVYFVGPPFTYLGNGSIEFIARARGFDVPQPIGAPGLPPPPRGLRPLVVFDPARMNELGAVRRRYPGTTVKSYHSDVDGAPLFAAYTPSRRNWPEDRRPR